MSQFERRPYMLIIRDGWGANPHPEWNHANAVHLARTPVDDRLMADYPHVQIVTHGPDVGLPDGVMGNSEVGHQNIGAGRIVRQEVQRINHAIETGEFFNATALNGALASARESGGCVHVMGLCSDAGVHSVLSHLYAVIESAQRAEIPSDRVFVHMISDGRDSPPHKGIEFARAIQTRLKQVGVGRIASVVGRFYAMDRDNRWERVEQAYRLHVEGEGRCAQSVEDAFQHYYDHPTDDSRHGDEFITPTYLAGDGDKPLATVKDGDSVIFFNFRGDRPREIVKAYRYDDFPYDQDGMTYGFERGKKLDLYFATMTAYEQGLPVEVIMPRPEKMRDILGQYLCDLGLKQFRCAETEKYPHVTFFFNDYREEPFPGEERSLVPSPRDIPTYDLKPEMSAPAVTESVLSQIASGQSDVMIVNYANGDMVGHTGNLKAAIKAVETVDECVGRITEAVRRAGGELIVTADHGNCEQMIEPSTGTAHTAHTTYDVELIVVADRFRGKALRSGGSLADIAPTLLDMMGLPQPAAMTGRSLFLK